VEIIAGGRQLDAVVAEHAPLEIDGDKARGHDFVPAEPVRVHQEAVGVVGQPRGDVVKDLQVPSVVVSHPKGRQLDPQRPLGLAHGVGALRAADLPGNDVHEGPPLSGRSFGAGPVAVKAGGLAGLGWQGLV